MKKISALFAVAIVAAVTGCASPSENLCLEQQECAGEEDPAAKCTELKGDRSEDEQKVADACAAENDAFAQCLLDNGKCEDKAFGADPELFTDTCKDVTEAATKCAADA